MAIFFQTCLLIVTTLVSANDALKCIDYVTWDNDSETKSAAWDSLPDLLVNCDDLDYQLIDLDNNSILGISNNSQLKIAGNKSSSLLLPLSKKLKKSYTCFKVRMNGTSTKSGRNLGLTHRGCLIVFNVEESLKDICYKNLNCAIQDDITEYSLKTLIAQYQPMFSPFTSDAVVCNCGSYDCKATVSSAAKFSFNVVVIVLLVMRNRL